MKAHFPTSPRPALLPLLLAALLLAVGCDDDDDNGNDPVGPTEEAYALADAHYDVELYYAVEFEAARDEGLASGGAPFEGTREEWGALAWIEKIEYLPDNFTHQLPVDRSAQWYELIGRYTTQFGWGWEDYVAGRPESAVLQDAADWTYIWQGSSAYLEEYRELLGLEAQ